MSYIFESADKLDGQPIVGDGQCVTLVREMTKAPVTSSWKQGVTVKGDLTIKKGTAIATFVGGKYLSKKTGNHAALYVGQDKKGVWVVDQWVKKEKVEKRQLRFRGKQGDGQFINPSNNGDAFSVIE